MSTVVTFDQFAATVRKLRGRWFQRIGRWTYEVSWNVNFHTIDLETAVARRWDNALTLHLGVAVPREVERNIIGLRYEFQRWKSGVDLTFHPGDWALNATSHEGPLS